MIETLFNGQAINVQTSFFLNKFLVKKAQQNYKKSSSPNNYFKSYHFVKKYG